MNIALWIAQILLTALFGMIGLWKTFTPIPDIAHSIPWAVNHPYLIRFIGISELAGSLGVTLPYATGILPKLTPLAALGLATIMVLAVAFHLYLGDVKGTLVPLGLLGLSAFVAWGRR